MTNMPEAKLAREAEIRYASVSMVTDFDCWHPDHESVDVQQIIKVLLGNAEKAKVMIKNLINNFEDHIDPNDPTNNCLDVAIITAPEKRTQKTIDKLKTVAGRALNQMKIEGKEYRTIWFENNVVKIIDQTKLPHQFIIKDLKTVKDAINAIKIMEVRGAPLIGGTAAYGIALAVQENNDPEFIKKSAEELIQSRPTAINLKWAVDRMMKKLSGINSDQILDIALTEAKEICDEDEKFCENIGINGLKIIEEIYNKKKDTVNILTHCNAGWLQQLIGEQQHLLFIMLKKKEFPFMFG